MPRRKEIQKENKKRAEENSQFISPAHAEARAQARAKKQTQPYFDIKTGQVCFPILSSC